MSFLVKALSRRATKITPGTDRELRLSSLESLAVNQFEPEYATIAARGNRYAGGCQLISAGIAPVAAIPTTTATLALFNAASDTGKSLLVDYVAFTVGSGTPTAGATMFLCVSGGKIATVPAAAASYSCQALSVTAAPTSSARWASAVTVPASSWFAAATSFQLAAANVGQGDSPANLRGVLVPPGYAMGICILSGTGTNPLYAVSAMWSELELDLEP